jgi:hypothetical protein
MIPRARRKRMSTPDGKLSIAIDAPDGANAAEIHPAAKPPRPYEMDKIYFRQVANCARRLSRSETKLATPDMIEICR